MSYTMADYRREKAEEYFNEMTPEKQRELVRRLKSELLRGLTLEVLADDGDDLGVGQGAGGGLPAALAGRVAGDLLDLDHPADLPDAVENEEEEGQAGGELDRGGAAANQPPASPRRRQ